MTILSATFAEYVLDPIILPLLGGPTVHTSSVTQYFTTCLTVLLIPAALLFLQQNVLCHILPQKEMTAAERMVSEQIKPPAISTFQRLYLPVFWLLRMAFWMSGPFFVPVYASKVLSDGVTIDNVFQVGFAAAALLLPGIASIVSSSYTDEKSGTIAAAIFYALGAASTQVSSLPLLLAGRGCGNIGTGLLGIMPEAWVSSEIQKTGADPYGRWLSSIFATAFAFDSIVAIGAGQVAASAAERLGGPEGPFQVSPLFLAIAVVIIGLFWTDTDVPTDKDGSGSQSDNGLSLKDAANNVTSDKKDILLGIVQCSFEAATYLFVLNQAKAIQVAVAAFFGEESIVPSGLVFACYMTATLLGSCIYGQLSELRYRPEGILSVVLVISALSLGAVGNLCARNHLNLLGLSVWFFLFEVMAGLAKPSLSCLRSKYLPIKERSILMTAFSTVFNFLVLAISLSNHLVGDAGVWLAASALLVFAFVCLLQLRRIARKEAKKNAPQTWRRVRAKMESIARVMQIRRLVQGIAKQAEMEGVE